MDSMLFILTNHRLQRSEINSYKDNSNKYNFIFDCSDNWDNYGYKTMLKLTVVKDKSICMENYKLDGCNVNGKSIFENLDKNLYELDKFPDDTITVSDSDLYRKLLNIIDDKELFYSYLKNVNDLCFNEEIKNKIIKEDGTFPDFVTVSFFRSMFEENRWNSFGVSANVDNKEKEYLINECKNIKSFLNIIHSQLLDGFSKNLLFNLDSQFFFDDNFTNGKYKYKFDIILKNNLDLDPLPTNCFAIIGKNGVGKTTLLQRIFSKYDFYTNKDSVFSQIAFISFDGNINNSSKNNDYRRIYIGNGFNSEDDRSSDSTFINNIINSLISISISMNSNTDDISKENYLKKVIENFDFDESMIKTFKLMKKYINICKETYRQDQDDDLGIITNKLKGELKKLSSGQKMIFSILLSLVGHILPKSLILIDEPENTLHPPFIMALIDSINILAKKQDSMVILSTHSPIIIQELIRDNVLIMKKDNIDDIISIKNPKIETFASSIDALNDYIFGVDIRQSGYIKILNNIAKNHSNLTLKEIRDKWNFSPNAMSYIVNKRN